MPRKNDPGAIRASSGQTPDDTPDMRLTGVTAPAIGSLEVPPETTVDQLGDGSEPLEAHIHDPKRAHQATAVELDRYPPLYDSQNVEGALDELSALIPPRPPTVGAFKTYVPVSGIPDWGILKLDDAPVTYRDPTAFLIATNEPSELYPYYWYPPNPAQEYPPFEPDGTTVYVNEGGNDPITDAAFNVVDGVWDGGGRGLSYAGAFTDVIGPPNPVRKTMQTIEYIGASRNFVVSGMVYPSDRGVLALFHWPENGTLTDFLTQPLGDRVLAAILLGQGISDDDGAPGGIFSLGEASGNYDPFAFPGQASGQYDLDELHTGLYSAALGPPLAGTPIPGVVSDFGAGQVRLGTDPTAGEPVIVGGITILGTKHPAVASPNHFFRYRLPYMDDYTPTTGIKYTPEAQRLRYFKKPTISLNPSVDLTQAGNYANLAKEYWEFQMARFRHQFDLPNIAPGVFREHGSFFFLHFLREKWFEEFTRDGTIPTDDKLYSPGLVDWSTPEAVANRASSPDADGVARSYHALRARVVEDPDATTVPTFPVLDFDYTTITDEVVWVSGVAYFLPVVRTTPFVPNFTVNSLNATLGNLYKATYHTSDDKVTELSDPMPVFLSLSPFSYSTEFTGYITPPPVGFVGDIAKQVRRQRIEFAFDDMGTFTIANGPLVTDNAVLQITGGDELTFNGDGTTPAFSRDAKMRLFVRRPAGHSIWSQASQPISGEVIPPSDGNTVMFHTTAYTNTAIPVYGNFAPLGTLLPSLETALKDIQERFLDEVYRWNVKWPGVPATPQSYLLGPGIPGGAASPNTALVVRPGTVVDPNYTGASWIQGGFPHYQDDLNNVAVGDDLAVAGMPDRTPPLSDGVTQPLPSSGVVMYPYIDYLNGTFRPSNLDSDITANQPNYSTITGDRSYVRALDTGFTRSATPDPTANQPYFTLKISGVKLENLAYANYVPVGPRGLAVFVKVPGSTTWLDAGRVDGDGPSKQDALLDGAGCQVVGIDTFDDIDAETGIVYCQVRCHVGPAQNLFTNTASEVPILVKVVLYDNANGKSFNAEHGGAPGSSLDIRGVMGLEIIRTFT